MERKALIGSGVAVVIIIVVVACVALYASSDDDVIGYTVDDCYTSGTGTTWITFTFDTEIERGTGYTITVDGIVLAESTLGKGDSFSSIIDLPDGYTTDYVLAHAVISIDGADTARTN